MLFSKTVTSSTGEALVSPPILMPDMQGRSRRQAPGHDGRVGATALLLAAMVCSAALLVLPGTAHGAGLGRLTVRSQLGQALSADVDVTSVGTDEAPSMQVRLATQAAFKQANLEFNPALTQLRFDLEARSDRSYVVHITSALPINEPYLDLLLELSWANGRVLREYTVLLDPPGLRESPEIIAPATSTAPIAATSAAVPAGTEVAPVAPAVTPTTIVPTPIATPVPPPAPEPAPSPASKAAQTVPAPQPLPSPTPYSAPAASATPAVSAPSSVTVRPGDTLSRIALANKSPEVSLDQMLVALLHKNPDAFINGNMNLLLAGKTVSVPSADAALSVDEGQAQREVAAQSADFAAYRSRLAQSVAAAPAVPEKQANAAGQGRITPKVEDKGAAQKSGDQLKIAKADAKAAAAAAAAAKKDEEIARQRAIKEQQDRAAALEKANADIRHANEIAAKAAAAAQQQAEAAKAAAKADAAKLAAAAKTEASKVEAPKLEAPKIEGPRPEPAKAPPAKVVPPAPGMFDNLSMDSPVVLGGAGCLLLAALVGLNIARRRRGAGADQFKADGDPMAANSLFGAAGGQSVDTGATSTFNSSFIPAASQLDSNEVDPVAEADVYVAYGREEQAEDILKEALRVQPDRHAVRVKLLEIYSRRGDTASFNAVAQELHDRTNATGDEWARAAKMGKTLDPSNPLYAGAAPLTDIAAPRPLSQDTDIRLGGTPTTPYTDLGLATSTRSELEFDTIAHMVGDKTKLQVGGLEAAHDTALAPETMMPAETPASAEAAAEPAAAPVMRGLGEVKLPDRLGVPTVPAAPTVPPTSARPTSTTLDFGSLDFDLGPSKLNVDAQTVLPMAEREESEREREVERERQRDEMLMPATIGAAEPPTIPSLDLMFPPTQPATRPGGPPPTVSGSVPIPNLDLNLPSTTMPRTETQSPGSLEEALSRPALVGALGGGGDDLPRLSSNTDQATVPLIDFDLSGADAALSGRRTETQAGSPMASQMATKLDLARGYIDLGVKDGARELLEEVMKDGTREQRQQAVELIKLVEA
jgi:pilus assembly protein FimV